MNDVKLSKKQIAIFNSWNLAARYIIAEGAVRTGKTLFLSYSFALLMDKLSVESPVKGQNTFGVLGQASIKYTHINVAQSVATMLGLRGWKVKTKGFDYEFRKGGRKITLLVASINNKASYAKIQGGTFRSLFLDEAPLMNTKAIDVAIERVQNFKDSKIYMTGNPEGGVGHWFYKRFLANVDKDAKVMHLKLTDNPQFTEEDIERMKRVLTTTSYKRKILGQWVQPTGAVYPETPKIVDTMIVPDFITVGFDYADVNDATSGPVHLINEDEYQVVDEYYWKSEETMTMPDQLNAIRKFIWELWRNYRVPIYVYFETAPAALFILADTLDWWNVNWDSVPSEHAIKQSKWNMKVVDKDGDYLVPDITIDKVSKAKTDEKAESVIKERIDATNLLIGLGLLTIHEQAKDKPIASAFSEAVYDDKGNRLDNGSSNIDSLDGHEYGLKFDHERIFNLAWEE